MASNASDALFLSLWAALGFATAWVAYRRQRSPLAWFLIGMLLPLAALAWASRPRRPDGAPDGLTAKALLVLSPMAAAWVFVLLGSRSDSSGDYWNAAPWLVVASLPVCAIAAVIVKIFSAVASANEREMLRAKAGVAPTRRPPGR